GSNTKAPSKRHSASKPKAAATATTVGVAKYRDPETGKTWTGRGKPPNWIAAAKDRTPFLIDESASAKGSRRPDGRKARKATLAGDALSPGRSTGAGRKARAPAKSPAVQTEPPTAQ